MKQNESIDGLIERISEKFGYDDDLKASLNRIVPVMTKGKSDEIKELLYKALERTKIFVLDEHPTWEQYEECKEEIMGNVNKDVKFIEEDRGEYSKNVPAGAYVNEPVFDENMNIVDRTSFIYVSKLSKYDKMTQEYGTQINLSHLIHELGHAWASEKDEFVQSEDGSFISNVGALTSSYHVDKEKREVIPLGTKMLYDEETLNTIEEENALFDLLNVSSLKELKEKGYVQSSYQWFMADIMREHVEKFGSENFDKFRYLKDRNALRDIETSIENTEAWGIMKTQQYSDKKKAKFDKINELEVTDGAKKLITDIVEKYNDVFFPDNSNFTPLEKLDNVFEQLYSIGGVKFNFGSMENDKNREVYGLVTTSIISEGYVPGRQAKEIVKEEKVEEQSSFLSELKSCVKTDEEFSRAKVEKDERKVIAQEEKTI